MLRELVVGSLSCSWCGARVRDASHGPHGPLRACSGDEAVGDRGDSQVLSVLRDEEREGGAQVFREHAGGGGERREATREKEVREDKGGCNRECGDQHGFGRHIYGPRAAGTCRVPGIAGGYR